MAPSALDLAAVLFHRTARHVRATRGAIPRGWHDALRDLARMAWRLRARAVDAVVFDGALTVSMELPAGDAPAPPARHARAVARATGLALAFEDGEHVPQPRLRRREPARVALSRTGRWYLARVASLEDDVVHDRDPEAVHQLRVALRRLRCVLRVVDRAASPAWMPDALAYVRALGAKAGAVRDLDVTLELLAKLDLPRAARDEVTRRLREAREPAQAALRELLEGASLAAPREALVAGLVGLGGPAGSLRRAARRHFQRELAGLERALGGDLQRAEGFHEVRKRARRVRDAIDVLGRALKKPERRWRRRLQPLQSHLGSLNDVAIALAALPGDDAAARAVRETLERRRLTLLAELATPMALLAGALDRM